MHPDQRSADVHTGFGPNFLHQHRVAERLPAGGGPTAARMGLRQGGHDLIPPFSGDGAFHHHRPVQMFAALGGQRRAAGPHRGLYACQNGLRSLHAGMFADTPAHDLAAGAAHHQQVAGAEVRGFQKFRSGLPGLRSDRFKFHCRPSFLFLLYTLCQ